MILFFRILVYLATVGVAWCSVEHYTFHFHRGYPLWPLPVLLVLALLSSRLRRAAINTPLKRHNYDHHRRFDDLLLFLLALAGAAAILNLRGEPAFQPQWALRLAVLTVFLQLVPTLIAAPFTRHHLLIHTVAALGLIGLLWKGSRDYSLKTMESRTPLIFDSAVSRPSRKASQKTDHPLEAGKRSME